MKALAMLAHTMEYIGLVRAMSNADYHAGPGVGHSQLIDFARSPERFHALYRAEGRPAREATANQAKGSLTHCALLEAAELPFRYIVGPNEDKRTTAWRDFAAKHADRIVLKPSELAATQAQVAAVRGHTDAARVMATGEPEVSAYWRDASTGLLCRCRPDWVHPVGTHGVILADVKTCQDASPEAFARDVARWRYHWQAAYYTDGYSIASGLPVAGFVFVVIEQEYPYGVAAYMLDEASMRLARDELAPVMERFAECQARDEWPGYSARIETLTLPRWYRPNFAEAA